MIKKYIEKFRNELKSETQPTNKEELDPLRLYRGKELIAKFILGEDLPKSIILEREKEEAENELLRINRKNELLGMSFYRKTENLPEDIYQLSLELENELRLFKFICFKEKDKENIKKIKDYYIEKYELRFSYAGFYYRELDPLSKKFNGDYRALLLIRFQNALFEFYCDYFLLIDDPKEFQQEILSNSYNLSPSYLMRCFYILLEGYKICLPLATLASHLTSPTESILNKSKVTTIGQLKISKAFSSFMLENNVTLSSSFIFEVVTEAISDWESQNPSWCKTFIQDDINWKFKTKYLDDSDCKRTGGIFNLHSRCNGLDFPVGHRFSNNSLPILLHERSDSEESVTTRPDCLLKLLGENINFSSIVENYVRDKINLPRIGEGQWLGELLLLKKVRSLTSLKVIHQWSPVWLGRQRIDIGIPDLNLGFEYNGKQHYEAVDFFGGRKALKANKKRDQLKRDLCKENGINLIEIKYDVVESEVDNLLTKIFDKKKSA